MYGNSLYDHGISIKKELQKTIFHSKGINTITSCLYLPRRKPIWTITCHPGYPVRENTNIPTNFLEVVPLLE